jgi:hypothetical protein
MGLPWNYGLQACEAPWLPIIACWVLPLFSFSVTMFTASSWICAMRRM